MCTTGRSVNNTRMAIASASWNKLGVFISLTGGTGGLR